MPAANENGKPYSDSQVRNTQKMKFYRGTIRQRVLQQESEEALIAFHNFGADIYGLEDQQADPSSLQLTPPEPTLSNTGDTLPEDNMTEEEIKDAIDYQMRAQNLFFARRIVRGQTSQDLPHALQEYAQKHDVQIGDLIEDARKELTAERNSNRR